jgi:acetyl esterase/lipase
VRGLVVGLRDEGRPLPAAILAVSPWYDTEMTCASPAFARFRACSLGGGWPSRNRRPPIECASGELPGLHTGGPSHCPLAVAKEIVEGIGKSALAV